MFSVFFGVGIAGRPTKVCVKGTAAGIMWSVE